MSATTIASGSLVSKASVYASNKMTMAKALAGKTATNARTAQSRIASETATRPMARGLVTTTALSSPSVYHLGLKATRTVANIAKAVVTTTMHAVNCGIGFVGYVAAKAIGYVLPTAGAFVQDTTYSVTGAIATAIDVVDTASTLLIEANFAASYAPTTTKVVTRTATILMVGMLLNVVTAGRFSVHIARIPVVGPALAVGFLGGAAAWNLIRLAWSFGVIYTCLVRSEQVLDIYYGRVPVKSFVEDLKDEWHLTKATAEVVAEAEEIAKAAAETVVIPDADIQASVDKAVAASEARQAEKTSETQAEATVEEIAEVVTVPTLDEAIEALPDEEKVAVADAVVKQLRQPTQSASKRNYPAKRNTHKARS